MPGLTRRITIHGITLVQFINRAENVAQLNEEFEALQADVRARFSFAGIEPDRDSDLKVLTLLLKLLGHAQFFPQSDKNRRTMMHAISACVEMLSERSRYRDEVERFIEGYEQDEKSIWRDLIFLRKLDEDGVTTGAGAGGGADVGKMSYPMCPARLVRIFDNDLKHLARITVEAINNVRVDSVYRDSRILSNVYEWATYFREQECLERILKLCSEESLTAIDISTELGKSAILRILQIIGENVTKKNLSASSRALAPLIDFDLLVSVRNRLAHNEWDLFDNKFKEIYDLNYVAILADIRAIRAQLEVVYRAHQQCKKTPDVADSASDQALTQFHADPPAVLNVLPADLMAELMHFFQELNGESHLRAENYTTLISHFEASAAAVSVEFTERLKAMVFVRNRLVEADFIEFLKQDIDEISRDFILQFKTLVSVLHPEGSDALEKDHIKRFMGAMHEKIKNARRRYERAAEQEAIEAARKRGALLNGLRAIQALLPDDSRYKASKAEEGEHDLNLVVDHMLDAIAQIEKLLSMLKDYALFDEDMVRPFSQDQCFMYKEELKMSFGNTEVDAAHDFVRRRLTQRNEGFVFSYHKVLVQAPPHSTASIRATISPAELKELIPYVQRHQLRIAQDLMTYALQLRMADELAANAPLRMAVELFVVRLVPFLRFAVVHKLPGFGDRLKKLELRFYRNFLEHGNIFIEAANLPPEEFLIRYLSDMLKELKPILQGLKPHLNKDVFKTIYGGALKFTTADLAWLKQPKVPLRRGKTRRELETGYDFAITDYGAAGDCLFRAIAAPVGANAELGTTGDLDADNVTLRQLTVAAILSQREVFGNLLNDERLMMPPGREVRVGNFDTYVRLMGINGTWGGQVEIFALARLLNRPIALFGPNIRPQLFEENATGEPLFLYYEGNHYQAIRPNHAAPRVFMQQIIDELQALQAPGATGAEADAGAVPVLVPLEAPVAGPALFAPAVTAADAPAPAPAPASGAGAMPGFTGGGTP